MLLVLWVDPELRHICILKLVKFFARTLDLYHFGFDLQLVYILAWEPATCAMINLYIPWMQYSLSVEYFGLKSFSSYED